MGLFRRSRATKPPAVRAPLFVDCAEQLENVRIWNRERNWGLGSADFDLVADESSWPAVPPGALTTAVLVPSLAGVAGVGAVQRTFDELWGVAAAEQPSATTGNGLRSDPNHLRLLGGGEDPPGLRWEVIDLSAKQGEEPSVVRGPAKSPNAGVIAAACHFPEWVRAMSSPFGTTAPGDPLPVFLAGYEATIEIPEGFVRMDTGDAAHERAWDALPGLFWDRADQELRFSCYALHNAAHPKWAVPEIIFRQRITATAR